MVDNYAAIRPLSQLVGGIGENETTANQYAVTSIFWHSARQLAWFAHGQQFGYGR